MLPNVDLLEKELDTLNAREVISFEYTGAHANSLAPLPLQNVLNDELSILLANQDSFERQMISIKSLVFVFEEKVPSMREERFVVDLLYKSSRRMLIVSRITFRSRLH